MSNKKKRTKRAHGGMKKPSKTPKTLSNKERVKVLEESLKHSGGRAKQPLNHKPQDSQHLRRGNR